MHKTEEDADKDTLTDFILKLNKTGTACRIAIYHGAFL